MKVADLLKDIRKALKYYPALKLVEDKELISVVGEIPLIHQSFGEFDRYSVSIRFTTAYPFCFPRVVETSKKIPRKLNRHINSDKTLCFGVYQDEYQCAQNGITFKYFLDKILVPHLSRETYRSMEGIYPDGERGHGVEGVWDYYFEHTGVTQKDDILTELNLVLKFQNAPGRNELCYCGSEKKFKQCHLDSYNKIMVIGYKRLKAIVSLLTENLKNET